MNPVGYLLFDAFVFFIYWLPTVLAYSNKRRQKGAILALNLFLGWTGLGWIAAMVWACMEDRP